MNFKKLMSVIAAAAVAAACLSVPAFADDETAAETAIAEEAEESDPDLEDIEMPVTRAILTNGMWGQSITYSQSELSADRFTEDTQILVEFETEGEAPNGNAPVELILQNYSTEPQIWAKVSPAECDETSAVFNYADMITAYGMDDLSGVNNICIGDCGEEMKVTKFTATNCKPKPAAATAETTAAATEAVTEAPETEAPAETTSAAETAAPAPAEESGGINMTIVIVIIVGVVVVAAAVVTIIVVKKSRKRFY